MSVNLVEDGDNIWFSFLNTYNNTIYFYDYHTRILSHKLQLAKSVNDTLDNITGFSFHNKDSLFIYGYKNKKIALVNFDGYLKKVYDLKTSSSLNIKYPPSPHAWTSSPMTYHEGKLYLSGYNTGELIDETKKIVP